MASRERETNFSDRMSEHEALMWNIEKDPWLNPSGGAVSILDRPVDMDYFRHQIRYGIAKLPRLYQRVVPGFGRLSTPAWVPDAEFDFDYHVREMHLPSPGTRRQLFELATQLYEEPLDRTRPLWRFVAISGLEGNRGALYTLTHHAISDGIGQLRMAELYQQVTRDEAPAPTVDLEAIIAEAVDAHDGKEAGGDLATSLLGTAGPSFSHLARRQVGIARRIAGEMALWPVDPSRATDTAGDVFGAVKSTVGQLSGSANRVPGGSPIWKTRSRHRHLEFVTLPLEDLKVASKALGGSVNDAFMAGLIDAAVRYHDQMGTQVDAFNTSFIVSTRTDSSMGGNSFTPVPVQISGDPMPIERRMAEVHDHLVDAREGGTHAGGISGLSGLVNLLPTSLVTRTARAQSARIDFATSNLRGAPFPLFCAGAKVDQIICMGPVAGTAANITAMSYDGHFDIGMFIDPRAISDPELYLSCVEAAFADLIAAGLPTPAAPPRKTAAAKKPVAKKAGAKKPAARKPVAKKAVAKKPAVRKPVAKKAVANKPAARKPAARKPAASKPVAKTPAAKKPAVKTPAVSKPAVKKPAVKKRAVKTPAVKKPAVKKPAVKTPAVKKPAVKKDSS